MIADFRMIRQTHVFQGVTANEIYRTMLDPVKHGKMIGAEVVCDPRIGGRFSVEGGLIEGRILGLEPGREIEQLIFALLRCGSPAGQCQSQTKSEQLEPSYRFHCRILVVATSARLALTLVCWSAAESARGQHSVK